MKIVSFRIKPKPIGFYIKGKWTYGREVFIPLSDKKLKELFFIFLRLGYIDKFLSEEDIENIK